MRVYSSYKEVLKSLKNIQSIGLVPTMGSLHEGHISLIERASGENKIVIVSIYVNPTQFNDKEDLRKYPRNIQKDLEKLHGLDNVLVYAPEDNDLYEENESSNNMTLEILPTLWRGNIDRDILMALLQLLKSFLKYLLPIMPILEKRISNNCL